MKPYVKVALFFVSFIAFAAILAALYLYNLKNTDLTKARPDYVLSATLLQKEFEAIGIRLTSLFTMIDKS